VGTQTVENWSSIQSTKIATKRLLEAAPRNQIPAIWKQYKQRQY